MHHRNIVQRSVVFMFQIPSGTFQVQQSLQVISGLVLRHTQAKFTLRLRTKRRLKRAKGTITSGALRGLRYTLTYRSDT